jgi:hypothetical protein
MTMHEAVNKKQTNRRTGDVPLWKRADLRAEGLAVSAEQHKHAAFVRDLQVYWAVVPLDPERIAASTKTVTGAL